jgi:inhibitor of KinA sporulation pathway (predicted exonuclease)
VDALAEILAGEIRLVVLDVEATCWKGVWNRRKETIEIGAVLYRHGAASQREEFQSFVKPAKLPRLSRFCQELTGIRQVDVDTAPSFPRALHRFLEWCQPHDRLVLASWSTYDFWQLDLDLELHGLPKLSLPHLDVKKLATRLLGGSSFAEAAHKLGLAFGAERHRAISDARKTAEILDGLLSSIARTE